MALTVAEALSELEEQARRAVDHGCPYPVDLERALRNLDDARTMERLSAAAGDDKPAA